MNFEWQTTDEENEDVWQEETDEVATNAVARRRRWLALLLTAIVAGSAVLFLYREGQQRIEESAVRLEADVLSSHDLGQAALEREDMELLSTILSGRVPAWTEAQKERLENGALYQQTATVLGLAPVPTHERAPDVSFDAELREATVTTPWRYRLPGRGVSETVTLTQTAVYRKGTDRWLLSPPKSGEFWGNWRTREREFVTLTYPVRDEEVALKLARDLDEKVAEMCGRVVCRAGYEVRVRLERTPQSVLPLLDPEQGLIGRQAVVLPTPTLIGLPAGEAAYQALFQGYARYLLSALLVEAREWNCCDHTLFQQALLFRQLALLGVAPEPVTDVDYLFLTDQIPDRDQLRFWWREDDPVDRPDDIPVSIYAFLDFFRFYADFEGDFFAIQPMLEPVLDNWFGGRGSDPFDWEEEWPAYVRRVVLRTQASLPMPPGLTWPEQELVLLCRESDREADGGASTLVRFDPVSDSWTEEMELRAGFWFLAMLGGDDGYFLSGERRSLESASLQVDTYLYRVGQPPILVSDGQDQEEGMIPFPWLSPGRDKLVAWTFTVGEEAFAISLLDPDSCTRNGCSLERLPGFPVWSPDARQMLAASFWESDSILRRTLENNWEEVGSGSAPFWLDNETYGFIDQHSPGAASNVWLSRVGEDNPRRWLPGELLFDALPVGRYRGSFEIVYAVVHPLDEGKLLLVAGSNLGTELFVLERNTEGGSWFDSEPVIRYVATSPEQPARAPVGQMIVEPGRRWLLLPVTPDGTGLWLYDLGAEETVLTVRQAAGAFLQNYDWSADGTWLASSAGDVLDLVAPAHKVDGRPYRRFVFQEYGSCYAVGWLNPVQE